MTLHIILDNAFGVFGWHYLAAPNYNFGHFADVAPSIHLSWRF